MHMGDRQKRFYYWAMAPAVALVAVFFVVPLLQVLWLSPVRAGGPAGTRPARHGSVGRPARTDR